MNNKLKSRCLTWEQYQHSINMLCASLMDVEFDCILGIFQGGYLVAQSIADFFPNVRVGGVKVGDKSNVIFTDEISGDQTLLGKRVLVVDEVVESGNTLIACQKLIAEQNAIEVKTACLYLYAKSRIKVDYYGEMFIQNQNLIFPWRYLRDMASLLEDVMQVHCVYTLEELADKMLYIFGISLSKEQIEKNLLVNDNLFLCVNAKWRKIDEE